MSPDKAHTICVVAAQLYPEVRKMRDATRAPREAVSLAAELYDLAVERVRASGPTSTEHPPCKYGNHLFDCAMTDCPRHGDD